MKPGKLLIFVFWICAILSQSPNPSAASSQDTLGDMVNTYLPAVNKPPEMLTGKIVFSSNRQGNYEIYSMNVDGSGLVRLTDNTAYDGGPDWSPDGSKIAFTSNRDGISAIYVMNADGSGETRLMNNTVGDGDPRWSPDGAKIVFTREVPPHPGQIFIMNADGSQVTQLTDMDGGCAYPSWSWDGTRIVYKSYLNGLYTMDPDGQNQAFLWCSGNCLEPVMSPVADLLVVRLNDLNYDQITVYDLTSHVYTDITHGTWDSVTPNWSPGGSMIVFVSNESGNRDIYIANRDGSNLKRITYNPADEWSPDWTR